MIVAEEFDLRCPRCTTTSTIYDATLHISGAHVAVSFKCLHCHGVEVINVERGQDEYRSVEEMLARAQTNAP